MLFDALACNAMSDKTVGFRVSHLDRLSSVITYTNLFVYLITGETSYHNSTALLIGLTAESPSVLCLYLCWKTSAVANHHLVAWRFGAILQSFILNQAQSAYFLFIIWRPPALPHRLQCSTIGRSGLNHRVRDGNGCVPWPHRHQKHWVLITQQ